MEIPIHASCLYGIITRWGGCIGECTCEPSVRTIRHGKYHKQVVQTIMAWTCRIYLFSDGPGEDDRGKSLCAIHFEASLWTVDKQISFRDRDRRKTFALEIFCFWIIPMSPRSCEDMDWTEGWSLLLSIIVAVKTPPPAPLPVVVLLAGTEVFFDALRGLTVLDHAVDWISYTLGINNFSCLLYTAICEAKYPRGSFSKIVSHRFNHSGFFFGTYHTASTSKVKYFNWLLAVRNCCVANWYSSCSIFSGATSNADLVMSWSTV